MTRAGQLKFTLRKTLKRGRNIGVQKRLSFVFICDDIYIYIHIHIHIYIYIYIYTRLQKRCSIHLYKYTNTY